MQMTVDESKNLFLIPEIVIHRPILLLLQLCINRPHRYANFQFCSFIPANILTSVQRCMYVGMASRRRTTSNQRWNNVVYVNVEVYDFQQRRINVMSISTLNWITLDNVETSCHFQLRFSQRRPTSKQRCEYDHLKIKLSLEPKTN